MNVNNYINFSYFTDAGKKSLSELGYRRCTLCHHFSRDLGEHYRDCQMSILKPASLDREIEKLRSEGKFV